jgi:hypothetical protein
VTFGIAAETCTSPDVDSMSYYSHSGRLANSAMLSAVVFIAATLGCGQHERTSVTGKVTLDGQPLTAGQIVFEPTSAGRLGIAQISDGVYTMPATQGPTTGKYVVRITSSRPTGRKTQAGRGNDTKTVVDQYEQFIPAKYNVQSELTTEVTAEGASARDFPLSSK